MDVKPAALEDFQGAFVGSLTRNNKEIRNDRAIAIVQNAEKKYRRKIEDLQQDIQDAYRERENLLDLSPSDKNSLKLAAEFNADNFVTDDMALGVKIRNLEIQLEIAQKAYAYLFQGGVKKKTASAVVTSA